MQENRSTGSGGITMTEGRYSRTKFLGAEIAALKKLPAWYSVILSAPANGLTITHVMNFALDKY